MMWIFDGKRLNSEPSSLDVTIDYGDSLRQENDNNWADINLYSVDTLFLFLSLGDTKQNIDNL